MITQHPHPNRGMIMDEAEEQRRKRNLGGKRRPSWMNRCRLAPYLQIDGPFLVPPMEPSLTPPGGLRHQFSTRVTSFPVMNVGGQSLPLNAPILHLLHVPDIVIPNIAL